MLCICLRKAHEAARPERRIDAQEQRRLRDVNQLANIAKHSAFGIRGSTV